MVDRPPLPARAALAAAQGAVTSRVTFGAPGQSAIAEARFQPNLARDAATSVVAVDRAPAA
jgi:hypothetical protein